MSTGKLSEADFQRQIVELAHLQGWLVHHTRPAQNRRGQWATPIQGDPGFPDLVLARDGRIIFAELKSEKGKLTHEQEGWLQQLRPVLSDIDVRVTLHETVFRFRCFFEGFVWRPSDWPEIERALARLIPA